MSFCGRAKFSIFWNAFRGKEEGLSRGGALMGRDPVTIRYGEPIQFGRHDDRSSRERARPEATVRIEAALQAVMAQ